jgi:dUTP pyrophosphatase
MITGGEISLAVINLGSKPVVISRGYRVAQLVIAPVVKPVLEISLDLGGTARDKGGFGSTGV